MSSTTDKDETVDIAVTDYREHSSSSEKERVSPPHAVSTGAGRKNVFEV